MVDRAESNPGTDQTRLEGVDCTSITNCVAVGSYASASYTYPLIEAWNGSTWSIATKARVRLMRWARSRALVPTSAWWSVPVR